MKCNRICKKEIIPSKGWIEETFTCECATWKKCSNCKSYINSYLVTEKMGNLCDTCVDEYLKEHNEILTKAFGLLPKGVLYSSTIPLDYHI